MKQLVKHTKRIFLLSSIVLILATWNNDVKAQCSSSTASASSPKTANNTGTTITWSQKPTEYVQVTSATVSGTYKISSSNGSDYFTIKTSSAGSGGTVVTTGTTPVTFTATNATLYIVVTTNSSCNTNSTNRTISFSAKPDIASTTSSGCIGSSISITGTSFSGVTAVSFNGTNAPSFTVNSSTSITATVPSGATTGTITVTGPGGSDASSSFTVNPSPSVSVSASPSTLCANAITTLTATNTSGTVGTISGSNNTTVAGNGNDPQSVSTSITLASGTLTSLSNIALTVNADHTWGGDLTMTLTSPCGNSTIFNRPGGTGNSDDLVNTGNYVFTSSSSTTFPGSSSGVIPTGTYKATFSGISVSPTCSDIGGTWTLTISSSSGANNRVITLTSWSISISNAGVYTTAFSGGGTIGTVNYSGTNNTTATASLTPTVSGTYTAITTDGLGCTASNTTTVTINAAPTNNSGADQTICTSTSITIGASSTAGRTYAWSPAIGLNSSTKANPTATPTVTTTYTLTESINSTGCSTSNQTVVTVNRKSGNPTSATASSTTICNGSSTTLTLNGGGNGDNETVKWYTASCGGTLAATGNGASVSPSSTTTYYGRYEDGTPCSYNTTCSSVTITVNSLPTNKTVTTSASTVCSGSTINVVVASSTSGVSYQLRNDADNSNVGSAVAGTGGTINLSSGALTSTTTFNVLATTNSSSCSLEMTTTPTITVNPAPSNNSGSDQAICSGISTTIGASSTSGRTYSWSPSAGLNSSTKSNPTASPTVTTTYTLTETITSTGCSAANSTVVTVNPLPTNNSGSDQAICSGLSTTIGASSTSGRTYGWSPSTGLNSSTKSNPTASPTVTTTYTLTETITSTGCSAVNNTVVTVNPLPSNNSGSNQTTCSGSGITIGAASTSGRTYSWSPSTGLSSSTASNPTASPTVTTTYSLTEMITITGCSSSNTTVVTVNSLPANKAVTASSSVCSGSTINVLVASSTSGVTYQLRNNSDNSTIGSSVSGTGSNINLPTGALTSTITVNVLATTTSTGCSVQMTNTPAITVNPLPSDNSGSNKSICNGGTTGIGNASTSGRTYSWSPSTGLSNAALANPNASPAATTTYSLTETITATGCSATNSTIVTVNSSPGNNSGADQSVCIGSGVSIGAASTSGRTYSWSPSTGLTSSTAANPTASPTTNTTYTLTETITAAGCSSSNSTVVTVKVKSANPTSATASATTMCSGNNVTLTLNGGGGGDNETIKWYTVSCGGTLAGTGNNLSVSPTSTTTYYGRYEDGTPCNYNTTCSSVTITVNAVPTNKTVTASSSTICSGISVNVQVASSASGVNYQLRNDADNSNIGSSVAGTGGTINLSAGALTSTTTFNVLATNSANSCNVEMTNTPSVTVNPLPANNSGADQTVCGGSGVSIGASSTSGRTYKWSPSTGLTSTTSANPTATPTVTTTYTLTETTTATGCSVSNSTVVTVSGSPTNTSPSGTATICSGNSVNISIANSQSGVNYQLRNNSGNTSVGSPVAGTGGTISLPTGNLTLTTTFNVLATNAANSCNLQMSGTVTITVNSLPADNSGSNKSICAGAITTIGANSTSGRTYKWTPSTELSSSTSANPTASPTTTTTYTLTETITSTGCSASNTAVVTVNAVPSITITPSYCNGGGNVQLTSNSFASYSWSTGSINQSITVDRAGTYSVTVTSAAGCTGSASYTVALELVTNGDFSNGNIGFTSGYTYTTAANGLQPEDRYGVGNSANYYHTNFWGFDHTDGSGKFMIVNGNTSATPKTVWQQTVTIIPNTVYYFSAYSVSMNNVTPYAQLRFAVDGVQIGTTANLTAGATNNSGPFNWQRFYATWNSGSSTSAVLSIVDLQTAAGGNDFGLDDISCSTLSTVPLDATPSYDAVCSGGTLNLHSNITGGMEPLTYSWSGPNSFNAASEDASIANASSALAGIYSVTVTDAHGCTTAGSTPSLTVNTSPSNNSGTDKSICTGSSVSIGASSTSGRTYKWSPSTGLSTSTTANPTATPTASTTYTLTETITSTGCSSANSTVVTVNAPPGNNTGSNKTICNGSNTTIGAASTSGRTYSWSPSSSLSSSTISNPTASPTTTTTYTLTETITAGGCSSSNSVVVTVTTGPSDKTVTAASSTICTGTSTNIQVASSVSGVTYQLRNNADNSTIGSGVSGTGSTINLPTGTLTSTTTFNVLATTNSTGCSTQMTNTPTVTINTKSADPTSATAGSASICNGGSTTLTLNGGGGGTSEVVKWYSGSCGGTLAATGNGASVSPTVTTTYYGRYEDGTPCSYNSSCVTVTVTVVAKSSNPTSASASATTICGGSVTLNLNGGGGGTNTTIKWYSGSCGGTLAGTGNNLSVSPTSTTTYYGRYEDGTPCNYNTTCSSVTITVSGAPANKTVTAQSSTICSGSSTNIQVASSALGVTYQLRDNADNSNIGLPIPGVLGVTISLSTGALSSTTTFNVLATTVLTGCSIQLTNTPTVTVNTQPSISPQPTDKSTCAGAGNSVIFSLAATGTPTPTYQWKERQGSGGYSNISNGLGGSGATYSGATTNSLTVSNPTTAMNGWTYYCVVTNSCSAVSSNAVTLTTSSPGVWNGSSSIYWNDAANWCNGIPTSTTDVTIPSNVTYQPTIAGVAYSRNLTINSGATVTIIATGDLQLYGNLTVNGTYAHSNGLLELVGSSPQTVPTITADSVVVNNSSGITLSGNLTINGMLNFINGKITTNSNEVRMINTSTSSINGFSSSNYIVGNLRRSVNGTGSYDYPLGTSTKYELINITLTGTTGFNNILGTFTNSDPKITNPLLGLVGSLVGLVVNGTPINDLLNYGYWTLTPNSTMTAGTYAVSLNAQGQTNSAPSAASYAVLKRSSALSSWQSIGTHKVNTQSITGNIVTAVRSGLNTFSDYSIGYGGTVLPIKLLSFTAEKYNDEKDVLLKWSTAAEINNDHFELEVASVVNEGDELVFRKIGEVLGNGTTEAHHDYSFIDNEPNKSGIRYYREKQIDYDGTFTYSDIQAVTYAENKVVLSDLYPNPVTNILHFTLESTNERDITISIVNLSGQEIFRDNIHLTMGKNMLTFDMTQLGKGLYLFNVAGESNLRIKDKFEKF